MTETSTSIPLRSAPNGRRGLVLAGAVVLVNAAVGLVVGSGRPTLGLLVAVLPVAVGALVWFAVAHRHLLILVPFAFVLLSLPFGKLPGTGGTSIYPSDLIVALAVAGWFVTRLTSPDVHARWPRSAVTSWPFALFVVPILLAVLRGHSHWGQSFLSEPTRLLVYVAVASALAGLTPGAAYRGLVFVFYPGAVVQGFLGLYYLASGRSQSSANLVSTGGVRALALSTAMYLTGALVLALLNIDLDRSGRRPHLHLAIAAISLFGIVVSLGRTTFAAVAVLVPVLALALRRARRVLLSFVPLVLPVAILLVLLLLLIRPSFGSALTGRLTGKLGSDAAVITRKRESHATLNGIGSHPLLGFGFGRPVQWTGVDGSLRTSTGDPENSYVWLLAGGGAFALGALIVLVLAYFGDAFLRLRAAEGEARALIIFSMSMVFVFLVNASTGPIFSDSTFALTFWIALLLPALVALPAARTSLRGS